MLDGFIDVDREEFLLIIHSTRPPTINDNKRIPYIDDMVDLVVDDVSGDVVYEIAFDMEEI
jgi:hypothetical protein